MFLDRLVRRLIARGPRRSPARPRRSRARPRPSALATALTILVALLELLRRPRRAGRR